MDLRNKIIYISFFITISFVLAYAILYEFLGLSKNIDAAVGVGFIMLFLFNIFYVTFIHDLVLKDITKLKNKIEKVNAGHLAEKISAKRVDEIGDLFKGVDQIASNQRDVFGKLEDTSFKVEENAKKVKLLVIENKAIIKELSDNMNILNNGTNKQIKGIEEIEFSIDEMAKGINRINSTVVEVSNNANRSVEEAKRGNLSLERVVLQMNEIQRTSEEAMNTIRNLGEQIKEIQKIVDVIRSISSRTNLLALNATIEAERAGENGEGFVVVAEEIKDLAAKSTESTVKIEKIARSIMEKKDRAVEQMDKTRKDIKEGIKVVNEASQAFNKIHYSTDDIGNQLNEVSSSSEQLSTNTHQIVESIENTSKVAKKFSQNASNVETYIEKHHKSIDDLIESIEKLNEISVEINSYLKKRF